VTTSDVRRSAAAALIDAVTGALAPAWRLFVAADAVPVLQWRAGRSRETLGPWRASADMVRASPWRPWHLFVNDDENARLLGCSLVDRLADEAARLDAEVVARGVTLELVSMLVAREVRRAADGPVFQLRVVLGDATGPDDDGTLLLGPFDELGAARLDAEAS
jgi:hypothetical protein